MLGQTTDPKVLVPGEPESIDAMIDLLNDNGDVLEGVSGDLAAVRIDGWEGSAGGAFWDRFSGEPTAWLHAADAMFGAASALEVHAEALRSAQRSAAEAIELWAEGEAATAAEVGDLQVCLAPDADPGEPLRQQAREVLNRAKESLESAGAEAATAITGVSGEGEGSPGWLAEAVTVAGKVIDAGLAPSLGVTMEGFHGDEWEREFGFQDSDGDGKDDDTGIDVQLTIAEWQVSGSANIFEVDASGSTQLGDLTLSGEVQANVGVTGTASASITSDGIAAQAEVSAGASASASGSAEIGVLEVGAEGEVFAGAQAEGNVNVGLDGVSVGAEVFVGASAEGSVNADVGGVGASVNGEVWAGAGAEADLNIGIEDGEITIGGELGAALGVGGSIGVEFTVDVGEVTETIGDVAGAVGSAGSSFVETINPANWDWGFGR